MLDCVELVDSEDMDGCWWEVVVAIERAIEIVFIVFLNLFNEFCLIRTIDDSRKYRSSDEGSEAHTHQVEFIRIDDGVICWIVGVPSDFGMDLCHFMLMFEKKCEE